MKRNTFMLLIMAIFMIGHFALSAPKVPITRRGGTTRITSGTPKEEQKKRNVKIYEGIYVKSLNLFTYTKDNLVFKDKTLSYPLQDDSGTLDLIYNSIAQSHGVEDDDLVTLKVSGKVVNGTFVVSRIYNYGIPEYLLYGEAEEAVEEVQDIPALP